jgi:sensor histidine kinase YesM
VYYTEDSVYYDYVETLEAKSCKEFYLAIFKDEQFLKTIKQNISCDNPSQYFKKLWSRTNGMRFVVTFDMICVQPRKIRGFIFGIELPVIKVYHKKCHVMTHDKFIQFITRQEDIKNRVKAVSCMTI